MTNSGVYQQTQAVLPYDSKSEGPPGLISRHCEIIRGAVTAPQMLYEAPCMEYHIYGISLNLILHSEPRPTPASSITPVGVHTCGGCPGVEAVF